VKLTACTIDMWTALPCCDIKRVGGANELCIAIFENRGVKHDKPCRWIRTEADSSANTLLGCMEFSAAYCLHRICCLRVFDNAKI